MTETQPTWDNVAGFEEKSLQPEGENYNIQNILTRHKREINNMQNRNISETWDEKSIIPGAGEVNSRSMSNRRKPWLQSLMAFADDVSVVGLRYVANPSASAFRRSIWILLILIGAGFTTFQIQNRIRYYADYPVNVLIRVEHMEEMRFPTVTICNENMASLSRVSAVCKWR